MLATSLVKFGYPLAVFAGSAEGMLLQYMAVNRMTRTQNIRAVYIPGMLVGSSIFAGGVKLAIASKSTLLQAAVFGFLLGSSLTAGIIQAICFDTRYKMFQKLRDVRKKSSTCHLCSDVMFTRHQHSLKVVL